MWTSAYCWADACAQCRRRRQCIPGGLSTALWRALPLPPMLVAAAFSCICRVSQQSARLPTHACADLPPLLALGSRGWTPDRAVAGVNLSPRSKRRGDVLRPDGAGHAAVSLCTALMKGSDGMREAASHSVKIIRCVLLSRSLALQHHQRQTLLHCRTGRAGSRLPAGPAAQLHASATPTPTPLCALAAPSGGGRSLAYQDGIRGRASVGPHAPWWLVLPAFKL